MSEGLATAPKRYWMTMPVHPEKVVDFFLMLHHYWFDESMGPNAFTGMLEDARKYLTVWVDTGELPPPTTLLEGYTESKFDEWLESSWTKNAPTSNQREIERLRTALERISDKGCWVIHGNYPEGTTCIGIQEYARKNETPFKFEDKYRAEILVGKHLCHRCVARAALTPKEGDR